MVTTTTSIVGNDTKLTKITSTITGTTAGQTPLPPPLSIPSSAPSSAATASTPSPAIATGVGGAATVVGGGGGTAGANSGAQSSSASNARVAAVVFSYGMSSLGGVFVNKTCLSSFDFHFTFSLLLAQLLVSVSALTILRAARTVRIPFRPPRDLAVLALPATFFIANVSVGLLALRLVNIPMFSAFRRLSVLSVMLLEWLVLKKTASPRVLALIGVMVAGSFLAGLGDLAYDPRGYVLVFLNNFITAANLVAIKKASAVLALDALSLFYYTSCLALPAVLALAVLSGELRLALAAVATRPELQGVPFFAALSLSAASAFMINFFTNLCTQLTSPLTTAITGQMKNVLQTVLGIFAFGYVVTPLNLAGLAIALVGSILFAREKFVESQRAGAAQKRAATVKSDPRQEITVATGTPLAASDKAAAMHRHTSTLSSKGQRL